MTNESLHAAAERWQKLGSYFPENNGGDKTRAIVAMLIDAKDLADEGCRCLAEQSCDRQPLDVVLTCPRCGMLHVDAPEPETGWTNPPHKSHLCHGCGFVWRPADVPTNGVAAVKTRGERDAFAYGDEPVTPSRLREFGLIQTGWHERRFEVEHEEREDRRYVSAELMRSKDGWLLSGHNPTMNVARFEVKTMGEVQRFCSLIGVRTVGLGHPKPTPHTTPTPPAEHPSTHT